MRHPRTRSCRGAWRAAAALVALAIAASCQAAIPRDASSTPDAPTPSASASGASRAPASTDPTDPSAPTSGVVVDGSLLSHLPPSVRGVAIESDATTAAEVAADPGLGLSASAIAMAIFVGPGDSGGDDLAVVSVVQLRPDVFDDEFFAGWRASYDAAACEAAGGVGTSESRAFGEVEAFVTTCIEEAETYHAYLEGDVVVSVTSVGPGGFGEVVVAGLQP